MHQHYWLRSLIGVSWAAWPFNKHFTHAWVYSPVHDAEDALGVLLMGGEL